MMNAEFPIQDRYHPVTEAVPPLLNKEGSFPENAEFGMMNAEFPIQDRYHPVTEAVPPLLNKEGSIFRLPPRPSANPPK